jgi:hypothetical protein
MIQYIKLVNDEVHGYENVVSDLTPFKTDGYTKVSIDNQLPLNVLAGYYTFEDEKFVFQEELKKILDDERKKYDQNEFDNLKSEVELLKEKIEILMTK